MTHDGNLFAVFAGRFPADPRGRALIETPAGARHSYADAERETARLAGFFAALGLEPGARVAVQVHKSPAVVWLYLACLRSGLVFQPLNPAYTTAEVEYYLRDAEPALVVADPSLEYIAPLCARLGIAPPFTLDGGGGGTFADASRDATPRAEITPCPPGALAALLYTSGTTGPPKGIMLSHGNLAANARALARAWGFGADDVLLHTLPVFHVHGLFVALGCVLMAGAGMRFLPRFDAEEVTRALPGTTVMMGVPTYYSRLLAVPGFGPDCCRSVRLFTCGSAPLRKEVFEEFHRRSGHVILDRYGMTETNILCSNPLHGTRKAGAVGPPLEGVALRVVDADGTAVAPGGVGRVQVRGPGVFTGYWGKPAETARGFTPDGYFDTGDQGMIDGDGYLAIVGRSKDMIITGGLNVYPQEVERVLDELGAIGESAVIGVPDDDFGEAVVAVVTVRPGGTVVEQECREQLKTRLAAYKVPKRVILVDELPRNTLGKVQKNVLRERYAALMRGVAIR